MQIILLLLFVPAFIIVFDFFHYIFKGKRLGNDLFAFCLGLFQVVFLPTLYLFIFDNAPEFDCCSDAITFHPDYRLSVYIWIALCAFTYFYSLIRDRIAPPIVEVLVNTVLVFGVFFNIVLNIQIGLLGFIGNLPIVLLFLLELIKNQRRIIDLAKSGKYATDGFFTRLAWQFLNIEFIPKFVFLMILCLPLIVLATGILILFGQQPSDVLKAFTQTHNMGFSELNEYCEHIDCGGHYLCTIAAKGHPIIVKPVRTGRRSGELIICNRQLLASNAFEELVQTKFPSLHRLIRRNYDRVGESVKKHYHLFQNKYISDFIYLLMKPAEWFFIFVLYSFELNPEDKIASQYLDKENNFNNSIG